MIQKELKIYEELKLQTSIHKDYYDRALRDLKSTIRERIEASVKESVNWSVANYRTDLIVQDRETKNVIIIYGLESYGQSNTYRVEMRLMDYSLLSLELQ